MRFVALARAADNEMKKIAILQSNYIPWKGYFDLIAAVDELILYDDMQFTKNDWRNRNQIKTPQGVQWLTIPVGQDIHRRIRDVRVTSKWQASHWRSLELNYRRASFFEEISSWLKPLYLAEHYEYLSQVNRHFIEAICIYLGIATTISNSWDYQLSGERTERLVNLCASAGGSEYVSGPAGKNYMDQSEFDRRGITLTWFDYFGYTEYPQLWGGYVHGVTILDLLFNCGTKAPHYMRHVRT